ncbi:glycosyltransferase [Priestia aryabhattai]|uniref:glycosyltransferase n=1 Tax=Priestia aryabhattai TaxID=412384 RepID=UPI001C0DB76A|nr:glycosyltransferase [Priestia aryabhattai]MBU3570723.1 glycosyltransferase [Priestia aryabhattai]
MKPYISLCMIVKDEEKVLERCLSSVRGIVDEIIIVDTGSTDKTKEIALKYVKEVFNFKWNNNFGEARNFAQSKAHGEWVLILDADEYVDSNNLKSTLEELKNNESNVDAYEVKIYNFTGSYGEKIIQHKSIRLHKNSASIYHSRAIHEQVKKIDSELITNSSSLIIYHSGYLTSTVQEKNKSIRNTALLRKEMDNSSNTAFDYFNLGNEYLGLGNTEEALKSYITAYQKKSDFKYSWVSFCIIQIINCLISLKRYNEALDVIQDAKMLYPQSADFICLEANIYIHQNRLKDAISSLNEILNNPDIYQNSITSIDFNEYYPHQMLGDIYKEQGLYKESVFHLTKAFNINAHCVKSIHQLMDILVAQCTTLEIEEFIENNGFIKTDKDLFKFIRIFISLCHPTLALKYINQISEKNHLVKKGFQIKLHMIYNNKDRADLLLAKSTLKELGIMISNGCFDFYDLVLFSLNNQNKQLITLLSQLIDSEEEQKLLSLLLNNDVSIFAEKSYIRLLDKALQYKKIELFKVLLPNTISLDDNYLKIGHLLFMDNYKHEGLAIYEKIKIIDYDAKAFANILDYYLEKEDYECAVEWILKSINHNQADFKIFESAIKLHLNYGNALSWDITSIIELGCKLFPGSQELRKLISSIENEASGFYVGFFVETSFHYYVYESIINELVKQGVNCHLVINDNFEHDQETIEMYQDLVIFIENLDRNDIEANTISVIKANNFKYDCLVSPYYSIWLDGIADRHVRAVYGLLAKEFWNYSWWNVFYDKILCYSEYDYSRLNIFNSGVIIGNPKFDDWFKRDSINLTSIEEKFNLQKERTTILYAPTYGHLSSIDAWIEEINQLQAEYNVIVKLHHGTALRESEKERREYIESHFENISASAGDLFPLFELADFVITDNSSMIFESMLAEKDILLLNSQYQVPIEEHSGEQRLRENIVNINIGSNIKEYLMDTELFNKQKIKIKEIIGCVYKLKDGESGLRAANEIIRLMESKEEKQNKFLHSIRHQLFQS